jgi:hypothetical protein
MANAHRGEIDAELGGKTYTLCLTLGALADLEQAFGAGDLVALARRFEEGRLSARDLLIIIGRGLRGGGNPVGDDELASLSVPGSLQGYVRIASDLLAATFGVNAPEGTDAANPPGPRDA